MTLYEVRTNSPDLACEDCGCRIDGSERGRAAHQRWHDRQSIMVVDITERAKETA